MRPIHAPTTHAQRPVELSFATAVVYQLAKAHSSEPDQASGGSRRDANASRPPASIAFVGCVAATLARTGLPASFNAHRPYAAATAVRAA
jgi:hypothetical protein